MQPSSFFGHSRRSGSESTCSSASGSSRRNDETPLRRRENVVITSSEIGKVFDATNALSNEMKLQREALADLKSSLEDLQEEVNELKADKKYLLEQIEMLNSASSSDDGTTIPPEVSADVHLLHNSLSLDKQYKPEESGISPHNMSVRFHLEQQMVNEDKGYPLRIVKRAIVRYYETKRKLHLNSLPENRQKADRQKEENKLRSRRKRLFSARVKVARGQEKDRLKELHYDYVSDEEDCEGGRWSVRRPVWRSKTADALMAKQQQRNNTNREDDVRPRVPRVEGPPSERAKPKVLVAWALVQEEPGEDEDDQQDEIDGQEVENESREEYVEPRQPKRRKTSHRRLRSIDSEDSDSD